MAKAQKTTTKAASKKVSKASPKKAPKSLYEEIVSNLKRAGLASIPVQTLNEDVEASRYFEGEFDEFVKAAKLLGAKAVFVDTLYLEEEEFYYDSGIDDEDYYEDDDDESEDNSEPTVEEASEDEVEDATLLYPEDLDGMDLSILRPEITKYQKYVGEPCGVRLTVPGADHLEIEIFANWYDEFAELVDDASCEIENAPEEAFKLLAKSNEELNNID